MNVSRQLRVLVLSLFVVALLAPRLESQQPHATYQYGDILAGEDRWWALALDVDHSSFWATAHDSAFKFDIATGTIPTSFQSPRLHIVVPDYWFTAIAVVGDHAQQPRRSRFPRFPNGRAFC